MGRAACTRFGGLVGQNSILRSASPGHGKIFWVCFVVVVVVCC